MDAVGGICTRTTCLDSDGDELHAELSECTVTTAGTIESSGAVGGRTRQGKQAAKLSRNPLVRLVTLEEVASRGN